MSTELKILQELSGDRYASGEEISQKLHMTRSAVWKHIVKLRSLGYRIKAAPRRGYLLEGRPDKLLGEEILPLVKTAVIGRRIVHREEVNSTTLLARDLIREGEPEGTVILAERQTAARGRLGRSWETPAGQAISMSVILYPHFAPAQAPLLSLATGVAVVRAVKSVAPVSPLIKWPNDIYLDGRKLGGILVEMAAELDQIRWVVDSIGINVNNSFARTGLQIKATSLAEKLGRRISRARLAAAVINELDRIYAEASNEEFAPLAADFHRMDMLRGLQVTVNAPEGEISGVAGGIDGIGRLLVDDEHGRRHVLASGEATLSGWSETM